MILEIQQQNEPNCLVYAAAMVMKVDPEDIFTFAGHRGQEVWWPDQVGNKKLRGFHIQEIIEFGLDNGYALTPLELFPMSAPAGLNDQAKMIYDLPTCEDNFHVWLQHFNAILITPNHAVAWDSINQQCFDPNGRIYGITKLKELHEAWLVIQIKSNF